MDIDEISDEVIHFEGSVTTVNVNRYERNQEAEENVLKFINANVRFCGFDFEKVYGEAGKGLIHVYSCHSYLQVLKKNIK